jgi:hypothetical protein
MAAPAIFQQNKTSGSAVASLIFGILGLIGLFPLSIPAVICGHIARSHFSRGESIGGEGISMAGLILGYVTIGIYSQVIDIFIY